MTNCLVKSLIISLTCVLMNTVSLAQTPEKVVPVASAVVNMAELAEAEARLPQPLLPVKGIIPNKEKTPELNVLPTGSHPNYTPVASRTAVASPSFVFNYEAEPDEAQGGGTSGTYNIPPDTYGAVGLDKVFINVNNNYRILNKTTGAQISLVSMPSFWAALGTNGAGAFDPRVIYDPYNNRWILAAVSNGGVASSRVLLGISQTHDPSGNYWLFAFDPDAGTTLWADYPTLGFNKNWIAISNNMFTIPANSFSQTRMFVIDYPTLRTGTANATVASTGSQFTIYPAYTYSSTEETLYMVSHVSSAGGTYAINSITGTAAAPVVNFAGVAFVRPGGGWIQPTGNIAPQNCTSSCPAGPPYTGLDVGDSRISGNCVFRNGNIWYSQTVAFGSPITRTAAQWTRINTAGAYVDGGRVEVPTATNINGEHWYTYPSLAVNASNDAMMGFTKTESDGYAGAAYALRYSTDGAGVMNDPVIYKDGEDYYNKDFSSGRVRWGDYSHTVVDPVDDASFYTIQEYAKLRASPALGGNLSKWGTWLAKVAPRPCLSSGTGTWNAGGQWSTAAVPAAGQHVSVMPGHSITLDVDPNVASITVNQGGTLIVNTTRTLSCKLIVYGTLNITGGKLQMGNNDVFLSENATIIGASSTSYLVTNGTGSVSKIIPASGSFLFPVSPNTSSYNGLTINNTGGPAEVFTVRVASGVTPASTSNASCVQRTWNISEMTAGGNTASLTFRWAAAEHGASFNAASAYAYRHNGSVYVMANSLTTPVLASGIYSASTTTGISTFSPWVVASSGTLPITMEYFTGTRLPAREHQLDWKALCSGSANEFELERSHDGQSFYPLIRMGADAMRCQQPFRHRDAMPLKGRNFYRVKMRDEAGKTSYSPIVLLLNSDSGFEILGMQPNPADQLAWLSFSAAEKQRLRYFIIDAAGRRIQHGVIDAVSGMNRKEIQLDRLIPGTYLLSLVSETGETSTTRFIRQ